MKRTSCFPSYESLGVTGEQMTYARIFDKDGGFSDFDSDIGAVPTVSIVSPQVPGQITIIWDDFVTGEQGWRVQRSSDGVTFN